jgi:endonuclease/exonuclease/phosphatase family metal-dependent hydrolase
MTRTRRKIVLGLLLATVTLAPAEEPTAAKSTTLRVMAWNIHHGEGEDGRLDLDRIAGVIKKSEADVVLLQEVDDRTQRTGRVAQAEELARLTGLKATFGKAMDFQAGGYGNAILTRWAPVETRVVPLTGGGEPRCALEVAIEPPALGAKLTVVSTHLDVSSAESRVAHATQLAADLQAHAGLVLLGGDFNATPDEAPMAAFTAPWLNPKKQGENTGTIPSAAPRREIDFILIKPAQGAPPPTVVSYAVIEEKVASDHRPVVMEVTMRP